LDDWVPTFGRRTFLYFDMIVLWAIVFHILISLRYNNLARFGGRNFGSAPIFRNVPTASLYQIESRTTLKSTKSKSSWTNIV
jgi:hypothetical protein